MPKIKLESLQEGMVVASDVKNLDDMLLLPSGCTLSEKHINILQAWGITEVNVEASDAAEELADPLSKVPQSTIGKWEQEIKQRFWQYDPENPVYQELLRQLMHRKVLQSPSR